MTHALSITVVGLGKLGAPLAAVLARAGHRVIGADLDAAAVDAINAGAAPVAEPGLQACIEAGRGRLSATTDVAAAVAETDVSMLIVPTPSGPDKRFSNAYLTKALEAVGRGVSSRGEGHLVTVCSTVMPGSMDGVLKPVLEAAAGRAVGEAGLGLCYNPEFIALGSVIRDLTKPDMVLIGESDPASGDLLERIHASFCENAPEVRRMNFVNAEMTKIAVNAFVTAKISFANTLAELCESTPGGDVDVVTQAMGADRRIGAAYLKGAVSFGGPCFPRDNAAFHAFGAGLGVGVDLSAATDAINLRQGARLVRHVQAAVPPGGAVCVLGLSYKPDTGETEESPGLALCAALAEAGYEVRAHDPKARPAELPAGVRRMEELGSALEGAAAAVVMTPWPDYRDAPAALAGHGAPGAVLFDPWRMFAQEDAAGVRLMPLGRDAGAAGSRA